MEETMLQTTDSDSQKKNGFVSWIIFTLKSFIFPCFSPSFYREASRSNLVGGIAFFFIFAFVISWVPTIRVANAMRGVGIEIQEAYKQGEFPTIIIDDGIAKVDGSQPMIFENKRTLIAIDTTGMMNEIDTRLYSQGILLTRTEFHMVNEDGYQVILLSDFNKEFGNPIVLDKSKALEFWKVIAIWSTIIAFIGILIWNSVMRLAYLALLGLIIWGITSLIKKGVGFSTVLMTGILANVPVMYLKNILNLLNISFFTLYTILLIIVWSLALWMVLKTLKVSEVNDPMVAI